MTRTIRMVALCATLAMSTGALAGTHSPAKVAAPASKAVAAGYTWGKSGNGYTWGKSGNGYTWGKSGNGYTWGKSGN